MTGTAINLRPAGKDDVDWIIKLETGPDMSPYLCHWGADRHLQNMADPDYAYFIAETGAEPRSGLVILSGLARDDRVIELFRIASVVQGAGIGTRILAATIDHVFSKLRARKLLLDVFEDNLRAKKAYENAGFVIEEAVENGAKRQSGEPVTLVKMGLAAPTEPASK